MLSAEFFAHDTLAVARRLLGCRLVAESDHGPRGGRIVEVEAYCGQEDLACHASRGRTARTEVMFGPAGHAYVYLIYGLHCCLNIVTEPGGRACAVLLRSLEPDTGVGACNGPGRLCRSLGIDRSWNGLALLPPKLYIVAGEAPGTIGASARIGVDYAGPYRDRPWRFYLPSPALTRTRIKSGGQAMPASG